MDHPYLTRRHELDAAARGLSLLDDLACLAGISAADHAKLVARREVEMEDPKAREAAVRRAARMGLLLDDLGLCHGTPILGHTEWTAFLTNPASTGFGDEAKASMDAMRLALAGQREEAKVVEADGGSTSYSDYSDSHTESSDDDRRERRERRERESCKDSRQEEDDSEEGSEDYGSEEDESEEEDDESPSPPVKRRR